MTADCLERLEYCVEAVHDGTRWMAERVAMQFMPRVVASSEVSVRTPTAFTVKFTLTADRAGFDIRAAIHRAGSSPHLESEADGTRFSGEVLVRADRGEVAMRSVREAFEATAAADRVKIDLKLENAEPREWREG
jgi:hypothetical protein